MKLELEGNKYIVRFSHMHENEWIPKAFKPLVNRYTICEILLIDENNQLQKLWEGSCKLHSKDNYCKNVGRKLSMTRALKVANFNREQRAKFWEAYKVMRNGKIG